MTSRTRLRSARQHHRAPRPGVIIVPDRPRPHQCSDHEQRWPSPPATMRPFTAIGAVHCLTPVQVSLLVYSTAPVSPSTAVSLPALVNHTIGSFMPSVVVIIG